jgi:hypothetical protein
MAQSIRNNVEFRAMLTRKGGATGAELQEFTGRTHIYSTWSLRCMETEERSLYTEKDGRETRYMLLTKTQEAALVAKAANDAAKAKAAEAKAEAKAKPAANSNVKLKEAVAAQNPPARKRANAKTAKPIALPEMNGAASLSASA